MIAPAQKAAYELERVGVYKDAVLSVGALNAAMQAAHFDPAAAPEYEAQRQKAITHMQSLKMSSAVLLWKWHLTFLPICFIVCRKAGGEKCKER